MAKIDSPCPQQRRRGPRPPSRALPPRQIARRCCAPATTGTSTSALEMLARVLPPAAANSAASRSDVENRRSLSTAAPSWSSATLATRQPQ
eukprot:scaffold22614_cov94-Isochrysis_galbana.AAC.1